MDGIGYVVDVLGVEAYHCDSAVFQHVDVVVIDQVHRLCLAESGEWKHANLICNMVPCSWGFQLFESWTQSLPHGDDSLSDCLQFFAPFLKISLVVEYLICDSRASEGRRGVVCANHHLDLAENLCAGLFVRCDQMNSSYSFSIKAHILCEGLSN